MVWGATVAAVSAADPSHGISHHLAPNQQWSFRQAAQQISDAGLTLLDLEGCLDNNQKLLHTYFYHGDLNPDEYRASRDEGMTFVARIISVAERSLT